MTETTVFQSGNSQAVRLPKDFRFKSKTVEIFRRGDEVVLREKPRSLGQAWAAALQSLPALTAKDKQDFDQAMAQARQTQPLQERDWSWLSSAPQSDNDQPPAHAGAKKVKRAAPEPRGSD